ncbi:MAG: hypothetical protein U0359_25695 [Byssovorax sp.]
MPSAGPSRWRRNPCAAWLLALCAACSPAAAPQPAGAPTPPAPGPPASAPARAEPRVRAPLVDAPDTPLDITLQPIPGGRSLLVLSQQADAEVAFARRLDGSTGALGPRIELSGEQIYGAFDGPEGRLFLLSSTGSSLCVGVYAAGAEKPEARTCAEVSPVAAALVGDRVALLDLASTAPPKAARAAPKAAPPRPEKKPPAAKAPPAKAPPGKPAAKKAGSKKGDAAAGKSAAKKKPGHAQPARPPRSPVDLRVRWVSPQAIFDSEPMLTGLRFVPPLDGVALLGARARGPSGIDIAWYETAPRRRSRTSLGSGRLMAATLSPDGRLDPKSTFAVIDADLEYGGLKDHHGPRLAGDEASTVYLDVDAKGQLEAARLFPAFNRLAPVPAAGAIDPDRLPAPSPADLALFEKLLAEKPTRVPGQPARDPGLVAWAGDRGYFLGPTGLRSVSRADGALRDEPPPLTGKRARIAWGMVAPDGEALAFAGGMIVHVDPGGSITRLPLPSAPEAPKSNADADAGAPPAEDALRPGVVRAPELSADRRHVARIGPSFWIARGDVVKVWPEIKAPAALRGLAPEGASALVGGAERGMLLQVRGGALELSALDAAGALSPLAGSPAISPVRPGFHACERAGGGALVAGVSARDPAKVVAFAIDAQGHLGPAADLPLTIRPGETAVRIEAFAGGGAWVSDLDRGAVVWLDDDAHPVGEAAWPRDDNGAACLDGRPARAAVPSPIPGQMASILTFLAPDLCLAGEPRVTSRGDLVWLGSAARGLDLQPEIGRIDAPAAPKLSPGSAALPPAPAAAARPVCPADMVSIAGRFCVDRFEAQIADAQTLDPLSPDYPVTPNLLDFVLAEWSTGRERTGNMHARALALPTLPRAQIGRKIQPLAVSRPGARPNGYLTGLVAESACAAAGKRLCTLDEFVMACRGEDDTLFPYGDTYEDGVCNVFREEHPAALLHDNASVGHLDPRLNRVRSEGKPLFQRTGQSPACRSRWGTDAVYDMVGNLDEWIDEGNGAFAGGFYSRSTRAGCEALVTAHPRTYLDYSTGVRCCRAADAPSPP